MEFNGFDAACPFVSFDIPRGNIASIGNSPVGTGDSRNLLRESAMILAVFPSYREKQVDIK
jgi:hypothetical protein